MRSASFALLALLVLASFAACSDEAPGPVGNTCVASTDCGSEDEYFCATGFTQLARDDTPSEDDDSLGVVGLLIPPGEGYCMEVGGCASNRDCSNGAACFLPLAGVDPSALAGVEFSASDLAAGHCLLPCNSDEDCRQDDGFRCGIPLEEELAGIPGVATKTFCIPDVVIDPCAPNAAWEEPGTCVLTYDLTGTFEITGTPQGLGDDVYTVEPGTVVVRVPSSDGSSPGDGAAEVLCFDIRQRFGTTLNVFTSTRAYAVSATGDAVATGTLTGDTIAWDTCTPSASYCGDDPWTPDDTATGPGCLASYVSVGDVFCGIGPLCTVGLLQEGHNPQDETWAQLIHPFVFAGGTDGFDTVAMAGPETPDDTCGMEADWVDAAVQIPNRSPGRTWLSFSGTLASMDCTAP